MFWEEDTFRWHEWEQKNNFHLFPEQIMNESQISQKLIGFIQEVIYLF